MYQWRLSDLEKETVSRKILGSEQRKGAVRNGSPTRSPGTRSRNADKSRVVVECLQPEKPGT